MTRWKSGVHHLLPYVIYTEKQNKLSVCCCFMILKLHCTNILVWYTYVCKAILFFYSTRHIAPLEEECHNSISVIFQEKLLKFMFIGACIIMIVEGKKGHLMTLAILFHFLCAQYVSDINISIIRSLRLFCWITTLVVLFLFRCVLEFRCGWVGVVSVLW